MELTASIMNNHKMTINKFEAANQSVSLKTYSGTSKYAPRANRPRRAYDVFRDPVGNTAATLALPLWVSPAIAIPAEEIEGRVVVGYCGKIGMNLDDSTP
jgi:hypothetical protein